MSTTGYQQRHNRVWWTTPRVSLNSPDFSANLSHLSKLVSAKKLSISCCCTLISSTYIDSLVVYSVVVSMQAPSFVLPPRLGPPGSGEESPRTLAKLRIKFTALTIISPLFHFLFPNHTHIPIYPMMRVANTIESSSETLVALRGAGY